MNGSFGGRHVNESLGQRPQKEMSDDARRIIRRADTLRFNRSVQVASVTENGKPSGWYLMYTYFDVGKSEGVRIPLKATSEKGAIQEATDVWCKLKKDEIHQKRYDPCVIYKVPLE
jgi:hypothetical protein